jgi:hypothetical protein
MRITRRIFFQATGRLPQDDDLQRCNCKKAGEPMHLSCGWCDKHGVPIFECGCWAQASISPHPTVESPTNE